MLQLSQVLPLPLHGHVSSSQIWLTEVSFEKGKRYMVAAPSGKGKSTLVHILYGLRQDYDGTAKILGNDVKSISNDGIAEIRQRKLSVVFQDLRLFLQLNGWENIRLKNSLTNHKSEAEIVEMTDLLGITRFMNQPCATLSYGQRQRLAIVRALCQPFDLLLLDEPFSHLDEDNIHLASDLISKECCKQGAGFMLVSLGERYFFDYDVSLVL